MTEENKRPQVGVAVLIKKEGKILMGLRKSKHEKDMWAPPGGHLEFKEEFFDCAKREVAEECGLEIHNLKLGPYTNDTNIPPGKHYVTIFVYADYLSGKAQVLEPKKCAGWRWCDPDNLPTPLFSAMQNYIDAGLDK